MIELLKTEIKVSKTRIGVIRVKYYDLELCCDICIYRDHHLWIRMPELWVNRERKKKFAKWGNQSDSDAFQQIVLKKVFDSIGLDLAQAMKYKTEFLKNRKDLTECKNKITLNEKTTEA